MLMRIFLLLGYYWLSDDLNSKLVRSGAGTGLSDDAFVGIGYSTIALLAIFVSAIVLAVIPFILASRTIKGSMPLGGSNSMVISAACHVPVREEMPPAGSPRGSSETTTAEQQSVSPAENENDQATYNTLNLRQNSVPGTFEMEQLLSSNDPISSDNCNNEVDENCTEMAVDSERYLLDVSQKFIRWGAVETPSSLNQQYTDQGDVIGHLSFGTREHGLQEPVYGNWYV